MRSFLVGLLVLSLCWGWLLYLIVTADLYTNGSPWGVSVGFVGFIIFSLAQVRILYWTWSELRGACLTILTQIPDPSKLRFRKNNLKFWVSFPTENNPQWRILDQTPVWLNLPRVLFPARGKGNTVGEALYEYLNKLGFFPEDMDDGLAAALIEDANKTFEDKFRGS